MTGIMDWQFKETCVLG